MAEKVGVFDRLGWCASGGTTATVEFEFLEGSTLGLVEQFIDTNALRGTRSHPSERVRRGTRRVEGTINLAPNPAELATLLPMIFGGTPSGTSYPLGERLTDVVLFGVRDGTVYTYTGIYVDSATFTATEGGPMQLSMQVIGEDEAASGSMGTAAIDLTTGGPFTLMDAVVNAASAARAVSSFEMTVRNQLEVKYRNSQTPTSIQATDRIVTYNFPFSLGNDSALYGSALGGVPVTVTLTNGTVSLAFSSTKVQAPRSPLPFGQRLALDFPWQGVARKDGSTLELTTTLDDTP